MLLQDASGAPYPVMFWLYGGGYISGGSVMYPGHFLASKDVVVVVINYRIGSYGMCNPNNIIKKTVFEVHIRSQYTNTAETNHGAICL